MIDQDKLKQLTRIVDLVLSYDLEKLCREDAAKRVGFYNQIKTSESIFEQEFVPESSSGLKEEVLSQFSFAKALLAAAEQVNNEQIGILENFNSKELALVPTFDKYSIFDISTPEEIAEKIKMQKNIGKLAQEYQKEHARLDSILDSPEIRKDLKVYLKKKYTDRFKNVKEGIQAYIGKYGPKDFLELLENREGTVTAEPKNAKTADEIEKIGIEALKSKITSQEQAIQIEKDQIESQKQEIRKKLEQISGYTEDNPLRFISREDARKYEMDFLARFDTKMHNFPVKLYSPLEKKTYEIRDWGQDEHISISEKNLSHMPRNTRSRYMVKERKHGLYGDKIIKIIVEAASLNHLDEFEQFGYDSRRAGMGDLLGFVTDLIDSAELGKYLHVIGITSPTGWDEKMTKEFNTDQIIRNYMSRFVSLCLIDSMTGETFYNWTDERITGFAELFKLEFDQERIDRVRRDLLHTLGIKKYVVFDDYIKETTETRQIVNKVFYDLQKEGRYRVRQIKEIGLVLQTDD